MRTFPTFVPLFIVVILIVARRPAHMLRRLGAITPEKAQRLDNLKKRDRARLGRLMAQGVVRETAPGVYYYDVETERAKRRKLMPWLIGAAILLGLIAFALAYYNGHHVEALP